jgi:hypothetical protein
MYSLKVVAYQPEESIDQRLHTELWTSWASLLRSYAAAHGLNATQHEITLRVGSEWLRFTPAEMQQSDPQPGDQAAQPFALHEDGTVAISGSAAEEMDLAAERLVREMFQQPQ